MPMILFSDPTEATGKFSRKDSSAIEKLSDDELDNIMKNFRGGCILK